MASNEKVFAIGIISTAIFALWLFDTGRLKNVGGVISNPSVAPTLAAYEQSAIQTAYATQAVTSLANAQNAGIGAGTTSPRGNYAYTGAAGGGLIGGIFGPAGAGIGAKIGGILGSIIKS